MDRDDANNAQAALLALSQGGLCLFPTETFFALGCDARNPEAVARLLQVKQRPLEQGLPVLIGEQSQLAQACRVDPDEGFPAPLGELALELMRRFWPGPLSLVLPAAAGLAPGVPRHGSVALRQTPHPAAAQLSIQAATPLVASSANLRGHPPVTGAKNLNAQVLAAAQALHDAPPAPSGGLPSTLARPFLDAQGRAAVAILRTGAVSLAALEALGCPVLLSEEGSV